MTLRVGVTGATGFIGWHVAAHLLASGREVRAVVRPESTRKTPPGVAVVRARLDAAALRDAFAGVDVVVHLAALVSTTRDVEYTAVNIEGTRAVAEACQADGARLIHISSLAAAGPASAALPRSEGAPPAPVTPYGWSKLQGERIVAGTAGLSWMILRPGVVYGPGDRAMLPLFRLAKRGVLPLVGRPDAAYTVAHISDVVRAIEAALSTRADGETVFVGHPKPATARQFLEGVRSAVGRAAAMIPIPLGLTRAAALVGDLVGSVIGRPLPLNRRRYIELTAEGFVCRVDRLRDCLGVVAETDLDEGLAQTAAWYRRAGWI